MHWHIDYLLKDENTKVHDVLFTDSEEEIECKLAQIISKNGEEVDKFRSTDCD